MVSYSVKKSTREDQLLYTEARLAEIACLDCLAKVRVKKNSQHHTSIQWGEDGPRMCPQFNKAAQAPGGRHIYEPCGRLEASIERAVENGEIEIGAIDGY